MIQEKCYWNKKKNMDYSMNGRGYTADLLRLLPEKQRVKSVPQQVDN